MIRVTMTSAVYGKEVFQYATSEEAAEGCSRLVLHAWANNQSDCVQRRINCPTIGIRCIIGKPKDNAVALADIAAKVEA